MWRLGNIVIITSLITCEQWNKIAIQGHPSMSNIIGDVDRHIIDIVRISV